MKKKSEASVRIPRLSKKTPKIYKPKQPLMIPGPLAIDVEIKKVLPKDWKSDQWFTNIDNKLGYAKMAGYLAGFREFYLLQGTSERLLVEIRWNCDGACEQVVRLHRISKGKHKLVPFVSVASPKILKTFRESLEDCVGPENFNDWEQESCELMFQFSKDKKAANLYRARSIKGGEFKLGPRTPGKKLATLYWKPKSFRFELTQ